MRFSLALRVSIAALALLGGIRGVNAVFTGPVPQAAETASLAPTRSETTSSTSRAPSTTSSPAAPSPSSLDSTASPTAIRAADLTAAQSTTSTSTTLSAGEPQPTGGSFPVCHEATGPFRPFCLPNNGSEVWVDSKYYVTWDPDYFTPNSSIRIELNYVNTTSIGNSSAGASAYTSPTVPNAYGYVTIAMQKDWLQGLNRNNLTLYIVEPDPTPDQHASIIGGPTISLIHEPATHYKPPPHTKAPNHLGLILGLPISLGFVALVLCGLCFGMRKHRSINVGNLMGKKSRGYGVGQSRIERLGGKGRAKGDGAIQLRDMDGAAQYSDEPVNGQGHARETSIGSFVGDEWNESERKRGNVFRNEVQRLKSWR